MSDLRDMSGSETSASAWIAKIFKKRQNYRLYCVTSFTMKANTLLGKFPLNKFLFLLAILIAFQQSCGTPPPPKTPEPEKAEPPISQTKPEPAAELGKVPELSGRPLREELPESILSPPERELASPQIKYDAVMLTRSAEPPLNAGWQYRINRQNQIVGFEFSNRGGN